MAGDGMRIHFGLYQDGSEWSERSHSLGELRVGPLGLLSFFEGRLGLRGIETHPAIRIDQYLRRVEEADAPGAWFHASFAADPWSTAKQLLAWRDELVEAGWSGAPIRTESPRLRALAAIEQSDRPLAPGFADRLFQVGTRLSRLDPGTIHSIALEEPLSIQPMGWWRLFGNLAMMNVSIRNGGAADAAPQPKKGRETALAFLRRRFAELNGENPPEPGGGGDGGEISPKDESVLLVEADTEWEAAESLALWLRTRPDADGAAAIIVPSPSMLLDQAMEKHGLPRTGGGTPSRWRAHLQILPLVCANAWAPAELGPLVELLALPVGPVPSYAARRLLAALAKEPGLGGEAWKHAMNGVRERYLEFGAAKGKGGADADGFMARLERMLAGDRHHPAEGIPENSLKERCRWLVETVGPRVRDDQMLVEAVRQAEDLMRIAEGKGRIPRVALERMLDSVIGVGGTAAGTARDVSPWRTAAHPGGIAYPAGTLVWWDFSAPGDPASTYWSAAERNDLLALGVMLDAPGAARGRESFAARNAFVKTADRVLLFRSRNVRGEEAARHPFWDEIEAAVASAGGGMKAGDLVREAGALCRNGTWSLAGGKIAVAAAVKAAPVAADAIVRIAPGVVAAPEYTSYSDMKTLIECPLKWVLGRHAGIRGSEMFSMPNDALCMGNICHAIAETLFADAKRKWRPEEAKKEAERLYGAFVGTMYMDRLAEGREVDLARGGREVGEAFGELVRLLNAHGLTPEAVESGFRHPLGDSTVRGFVDMVCGDGGGGYFIVDFKWTGALGRYRAEVADSAAMQLAVYAWQLRESRPGADVGAGYYLLRQRRMLSDSSRFKEERIPAANGLKAVFAMAENAWLGELERLKAGEALARGVDAWRRCEREGVSEGELAGTLRDEAAKANRLYRDPMCGYCEYGLLCGMEAAGGVAAGTEGGQ